VPETLAWPGVFERPSVKRFALWHRSVVLSVCDVGALWPNGCTDQDETWQAGRPRPWPHCVKWGSSSPRKGARQPPHSKFTGAGFAYVRIIRGPCLLWPNGCMHQDKTWHGGRPRPSPNCVKRDPSPLPKGAQPHSNQEISVMSVVVKRLDGSRCSLVRR